MELHEEKRGDEAQMGELEARIKILEEENRILRSALQMQSEFFSCSQSSEQFLPTLDVLSELSADHVERYSRQMITADGFGVGGQKKLLSSAVLVIGAGGIGSTAIPYLAAAGVGRIGIVDFDTVDISNLHRQVIHKTADIGMNKAVSACHAVRSLNPMCEVYSYETDLNHGNALPLVQNFDCVVDCSDNPKTRYLVNDACVLAEKPLISASAIGTEGQVTVYNFQGAPCYRCLYPTPNAAGGCRTCVDAGVLGPVPGLVGILQATETLKVLTGSGTTMKGHLLMYNAMDCSFLKIVKPPKQTKCRVCGPDATILSMEASNASLLHAQGPMQTIARPSLPSESNITCIEYSRVREDKVPHILVDVRTKLQFEMCALEKAVHIPLSSLSQQLDQIEKLSGGTKPVYCICRRGVDSVEATRILDAAKLSHPNIHSAKNVAGGLVSWRKEVDTSFPKY